MIYDREKRQLQIELRFGCHLKTFWKINPKRKSASLDNVSYSFVSLRFAFQVE